MKNIQEILLLCLMMKGKVQGIAIKPDCEFRFRLRIEINWGYTLYSNFTGKQFIMRVHSYP